MAQLILKVSEKPEPPLSLGEVMVTVKLGQTIVLTQAALMTSSFPPYYQKQGYPIHSVYIIGYGIVKDNLLAEYNNQSIVVKPPKIAELSSFGSSIGFNNYDNDFTGSEIPGFYFDQGEVKIKGLSIGLDYLQFTAVCIDPSDQISEFSKDIGKLWINVVANNNLPPTAVGDGTQSFQIGSVKIFSPAMFTTDTMPVYSDPENDPAYELKLKTLPTKGVLTYNGINCKVGDIIPMSKIAQGAFRFLDLGMFTTNQSTVFNFELSDRGSQIFVG